MKPRPAGQTALHGGSNPETLRPNSTSARGPGELVRHIFDVYLKLGSVTQLRDHLNGEGRTTRSGKRFYTGQLANMLTNPVYIGKVRHKENVYHGNHKAIISNEIWDKTQALRKEGVARHNHRIRAKDPSLLTGKLFDAVGNPMSPGHARKKGRSYRYYISQGSLQGQALSDGLLARIPAAEIESLVMRYSQNLLANDSLVSQIIDENSLFLRRESRRIASDWESLSPALRHVIVRTLVARISLSKTEIELHISRAGLRAILEGKEYVTRATESEFSQLIPVKLKPVASGATYIMADGPLQSAHQPNPELVRAVARGYVANRFICEGAHPSQKDVAARLGITAREVRRIIRFGVLAPDIIASILAGTQPPNLTIRALSQVARHTDWPTQRRQLASL